MAHRRVREESGLTEQVGVDGTVFALRQRPLGAWFLLGFVVLLAMFCAGVSVPTGTELPPAVESAFQGSFGMLFVGLWLGVWFKTTATLELGPTELRVSGWMGWLARPRTVTLPTAGTALDFGPGLAMNGVRHWTLNLESDVLRVRLPAVICTEREARRIQGALERIQGTARARQGEGAAEVPDQLAALRGRSESDSR